MDAWHRQLHALLARPNSGSLRSIIETAGRLHKTHREASSLAEVVRILTLPLADKTAARNWLGERFDSKRYLDLLSTGKLGMADLRQDQLDAIFVMALQREPDLRQLFSADLRIERGQPRARFAIMLLLRERSAMDPWTEESELRVIETVAAAKTSLVDVRVFGGMDRQMEKEQDSSTMLLLFTVLIIMGILFRTFRKVGDVVVPLLGVAIVNVWMFGAASLLGLKFSMLTIMGPILSISLGIDYAIHAVARYREEVVGGASLGDAASTSVSNVGSALLLATLTTMLGFSANAVSPVPAVADFGITIAIGILASFFVMGIFVVNVRYLIDRRRQRRGIPLGYRSDSEPGANTTAEERGSESTAPRIGRGLAWLVDHPRQVVAATTLITAAAVVLALGLGSVFDWRDTLAQNSPLTRTANTMQANFPHSFTDDVDVLVEGDVATAGALVALDQSVRNTADDPRTARTAAGAPKVTSILAAVRAAMGDAKLRGSLKLTDANHDGLPDTDAGARRLLAHLVGSKPESGGQPRAQPAFDIRAFLAPDLQTTLIRVTVTEAAKDTTRLAQINGDIEADVQPLRAAGLRATLTGQAILIHKMSETLVNDVVKSTGITLLVCLLILIVVLRSPLLGLLNMVPVVLVIVWLLGVMRLLGYDINLLTVLITTMCVGVGIDFAIHITHRYVEERGRGSDERTAVLRAGTHIGGRDAGVDAHHGNGLWRACVRAASVVSDSRHPGLLHDRLFVLCGHDSDAGAAALGRSRPAHAQSLRAPVPLQRLLLAGRWPLWRVCVLCQLRNRVSTSFVRVCVGGSSPSSGLRLLWVRRSRMAVSQWRTSSPTWSRDR